MAQCAILRETGIENMSARVRLIFLSALGFLAASATAMAADKKGGGWIIYNPGNQTCETSKLTPVGIINNVRNTYRVQVETDDTTDDETGKVTATDIFWPIGSDMYRHVYLFRTRADCDAFADTKRVDKHKYE
jgi:hypothetical protein